MFEERMKLQADKIDRLMRHLNWTPRIFADVINVEIREGYKLLSGDPVNYYTAKAFIVYFKAPFAAVFIDFAAMEIEPPKFLKLKPASEYAVFGNIARNIRNSEKERKIKKDERN